MSEKIPPFFPPNFLADVMLGTLAKWMRILGYDTAYDNKIEDGHLIERCRTENRTTLTRDRHLINRGQPCPSLLIKSDELFEQVQEVSSFLGTGIEQTQLLSRCVECNTRLENVTREMARTRVPSYVFKTQNRFKRCPGCDRVYWGGTHRGHILKALEQVGRQRRK